MIGGCRSPTGGGRPCPASAKEPHHDGPGPHERIGRLRRSVVRAGARAPPAAGQGARREVGDAHRLRHHTPRRSSRRPASRCCSSATRPATSSSGTRQHGAGHGRGHPAAHPRGRPRSTTRTLVVADLPFGSYEAGPEQALATAVRLMKEGGAQAVKLEGGVRVAPQIKLITEAGIPVMAHVGFTPQSEHALGGYRVQGRGAGAEQLLADARAVQEAGAFAVVLEMVPAERGRPGDQGAGHPDHRHRRRCRLRRPGAGLAGHGRAHRRPGAAVRQAVRRPARRAAAGGEGVRRRRPRPARSRRPEHSFE